MRKLYLLAAAAVMAVSAQADSFDVGSVTYFGDEETATCQAIGYVGEPVSLEIPATVEYGGVNYRVTGVDPISFQSCVTLENVTFQEGIESIGEKAFQGCTALKELTLPNSLTTLGHHAFYNCSGIRSLHIGTGLTEITASAFEGLESLQSLDVPDNIETIGDQAFLYCEKMTQLTLHEGLKSIGYYSFGYCSKLPTLSLPESLETIGTYCFDQCAGLTAIDFGELEEIPSRAFSWCKSLEEVEFPESMARIGNYAFGNCQKLKKVDTGDGVWFIDDLAFAYCALTEVRLGTSVEEVGTNCFRGGSVPIATIYSMNPLPPTLGSNAFGPADRQDAITYVPADALAAYQENECWKDFGHLTAFDPNVAVEQMNVDSQASAPVYFDLTGRRVSQPVHGVYIKAQDGKSVKVAL